MTKYKVGLVGESNYQRAIRATRVGHVVMIEHQPDNPYDHRALVALNPRGDVIGYVPRDSWLTRCMIDEGQEVLALVAAIAGSRGMLGVVLDVAIGDDADALEQKLDGQRNARGCLRLF